MQDAGDHTCLTSDIEDLDIDSDSALDKEVIGLDSLGYCKPPSPRDQDSSDISDSILDDKLEQKKELNMAQADMDVENWDVENCDRLNELADLTEAMIEDLTKNKKLWTRRFEEWKNQKGKKLYI